MQRENLESLIYGGNSVHFFMYLMIRKIFKLFFYIFRWIFFIILENLKIFFGFSKATIYDFFIIILEFYFRLYSSKYKFYILNVTFDCKFCNLDCIICNINFVFYHSLKYKFVFQIVKSKIIIFIIFESVKLRKKTWGAGRNSFMSVWEISFQLTIDCFFLDFHTFLCHFHKFLYFKNTLLYGLHNPEAFF